MAEYETDKVQISDFSPNWINPRSPNKQEYSTLYTIIKFYLINTPCRRTSAKGTDVSVWGQPPTVLLDKLKTELGLVKGRNYDCGKTKKEMKDLFARYALHTDFTSIQQNMVVFLDSTDCFQSIFKHIRNSIAHSRWKKSGKWFYFEDGKDDKCDGEIRFVVTARIILCQESLKKCKEIICSSPTKQDLDKINIAERLEKMLSKLKNRFAGKLFDKREAVEFLGIDDKTWIKLRKKGKEEGKLAVDNKNKWSIQ